RLPGAPKVKPEHLGTLRTLKQIVSFLSDGIPGAVKEPAAQPQARRVNAPAIPSPVPNVFVERSVLRAIDIDAGVPRERISLCAAAPLWVVDDGSSLAERTAQALSSQGLAAKVVSLDEAS